MNDTLDDLLTPLQHLDPGSPGELTPHRHRKLKLATAGAAVAVLATVAIAIPLTRDADNPSLLDIVAGAERANALPPNAADMVLYERSLVVSERRLVCGFGTLVGDPDMSRDGTNESWIHGGSGRDRVVYDDDGNTYDILTTIVGEDEHGQMLANFEGTIPEPDDGPGCHLGSVGDGEDPYDGWQSLEQADLVAGLQSVGAIDISELGPGSNSSARAELFTALAEVPGAIVLSEPASDRLGRPVISVQVDVAEGNQRYTGTWRFDPETYELRETVTFEDNPHVFGTITATIVERQWLPLNEVYFDISSPPVRP